MRIDPGSRGIPEHLAAAVPPGADVVSRAPGRANLIGEHTDYNDGLVLPAALELCTVVAGRRADRIRLRADGHPGEAHVDPVTGNGPTEGWGRYVTAVVRALIDEGRSVRGLDGTIVSDVPVGAGLSSSAALEVALALALLDESLDPLTVAQLCQRAENVHVGVRSGIMDPLIAAAGVDGAALLIDCRTFSWRPVPMPDGLTLLLVDSGERRALVDGAYDRRRAECEEAAHLLGVASLRDVSVDELRVAGLPEPAASRARHVVAENERTRAAAEALARDDRAALGELFAASHASLRRDFEVTTPDLDALVEVATAVPGVIASRMTGAGFGGCTVSLVDAESAPKALRGILAAYKRRTGRAAHGWISRPSAGALAVDLQAE